MTLPDEPPPSLAADLEQYHRDLISSAARLHFPLDRACHHGGTKLLLLWAQQLRALADTFDALARTRGLQEHEALFMAKSAVMRTNKALNAYRKGKPGRG